MHLDGVDQIDRGIVIFTKSLIWNLYRQEEQGEGEGEGAGTGEDLRHLNAYNRRLRATQSPK